MAEQAALRVRGGARGVRHEGDVVGRGACTLGRHRLLWDLRCQLFELGLADHARRGALAEQDDRAQLGGDVQIEVAGVGCIGEPVEAAVEQFDEVDALDDEVAGEQADDVGVLDDVREFFALVPRVDGDDHPTDEGDRPKGEHEPGRVGHQYPDVVAAAHPEGQQAPGHPGRLVEHLGVRVALVGEDDRCVVRPLLDSP